MKISIALATYNGERFLREQLDSLAAQSRLPDELIITDDCSTDNTLNIIEGFARTAPFPVLIYRNERKLGFGDNFLRAAGLCTGDWIAFCDQDDVWLSKKLLVLEEHIRSASSEVMMVGHSAEVVDQALRPSGIRWPDIRKYQEVFGETLSPWWTAYGFTTIFRRQLITDIPTEVRGIDPTCPKRQMSHDQWISRLAMILGRIFLLPDCLVLYRRHSNTTTEFLRGGNRAAKASLKLSNRIQSALTQAEVATVACVEAAKTQSRAFGTLGHAQTRNDWRDKLLQAESYYSDLGRWLICRAKVYQSDRRWDRLVHLWRLFRIGGYAHFSGGVRQGVQALSKDIVITLFGVRYINRRSASADNPSSGPSTD